MCYVCYTYLFAISGAYLSMVWIQISADYHLPSI